MNDMPLWEEITREERYFCSFLFHDIRYHDLNKINSPFLQAIRRGADKSSPLYSRLKNVSILDVGYEVCFFRDGSKGDRNRPAIIKPFKDVINEQGDEIRTILAKMDEDDESFNPSMYPLSKINLSKQTFDIVLWLSDKSLVIIEAKAQQGYTNKQIDLMKIAKAIILVGMNHENRIRNVHLVALAGGPYLNRCRVKNRFDLPPKSCTSS